MARLTAWVPLVLGLAFVGGVVGLAHFAAERVDRGLRGVASRLPTPPDAALPGGAELADLAGSESGAAEAGEPDEPRLDLEHPTERDWRFLEQTLREGSPEARRSATKALVIIGDLRGVEPLFAAAAEAGPDADLFCYAALDILRLQRWEDTLPALLLVMLDEQRPPSARCRSEVADRFAVAGGRDIDRLVVLASHGEPRIRAFVAGYLSEAAPEGQRALLERLASDPDPAVRARTGLPEGQPEVISP